MGILFPSTHHRSRSSGLTRLVAIAGAAAVAVGLLAAPAQANPAFEADSELALDRGPGSDPLLTVAQAYLTTYPDLSATAARAAAAAQSRSEELKLALADQMDTYAGGWFDPYTASFHIAVTTPAAASDVADLGAEVGVAVETTVVEHSLEDLTARADELRAGSGPVAEAADGHVGFDVTTNEVVVSVPAAELGAVANEAPDGVRVEALEPLEIQDDVCTSRSNCDNDLRAGLVLRRSGTLWCSAGFTARDGNNVRWQLTAGHCLGTLGETWSNGTTTIRTVGPMTDAVNSGAADAGAIQVTNGFYSGTNSGRIAIGPSSFVPVTGESFMLVNDVVCLSASYTDPARSGNPCATVTNLSDPARRGQVRVEGYDACGGDSGGGWYWLPGSGNRWAVALHSGSLNGCNVTPGVSWLSPLTSFWTGLVYETG